MVVRELITRLGFDLNASSLKRYEASIASIKHGALAVGAVVAAAGAGLFKMVHSAAEAGDELFKTSQKVGLTVEQLQRLRYAAELADVSTEGFNGALKFLNRNLAEARAGNKDTAAAFKAVGINPKTAKDNEQTILKIADGILKIKDANQRVAVTMKIFGRSGSELIPFLNQGSKGIKELGDEIERLGLITKEQAKQGEEFDDNLRRVTARFRVLKNQIGLEFLPIFEKLIEKFLKWYEAHRVVIRSKFKEYLDLIIHLFRRIDTLTDRLIKGFEKLSDRMGSTRLAFINMLGAGVTLGVLTGIINPITVAIIAVGVALFALYDDFETFREGGKSLFNWGAAIDIASEGLRTIKLLMDGILVGIEAINNAWALFLKASPLGTANAISNMFGKGNVFDTGELSTKAFNNMVNDVKAGPKFDFLINQKVEVKVDTNADPKQIADQVDKKVAELNDRTWRNAMRALEPKAMT